jgi:hypothetical protein
MAAIQEIENGLNDGDLGGGLIKKRISRIGGGKRGGYRAIIAFRLKKRAFFAYGFARSAVDNLDHMELENYRRLAGILMGFNEAALARAIDAGELRELNNDAEQISK